MPVIVEGKYDKNKLDSIVDGVIIKTDGFGVFKDDEKRRLIQRYAEETGVIILTDSDSAGRLIRNHIKSITSCDNIINIYTPKVKGKERRKKESSKEGLLGVEGFSSDDLYSLLSPYSDSFSEVEMMPITRADLYADGLLGGEGSGSKRKALLTYLGLPDDLNVTDIINASGRLFSAEQYREAIDKLELR